MMEKYLEDSTKHDFDLELVYDALKKCSATMTDDHIDLTEYLRAYHELCRFFKLTGRLFGFVGKDLEHKLSVIDSKRASSSSIHYKTVEGMLAFEVNNRIAMNKGAKMSGSRTLLRLQWALEFILEFMSRLSDSSDHAGTSTIASEVYSETLSKHHPWVTRKMAVLAMYFLPSRKELICGMCKQEYDTVLELLSKVVTVGKSVYSKIQEVYVNHDLLHIP